MLVSLLFLSLSLSLFVCLFVFVLLLFVYRCCCCNCFCYYYCRCLLLLLPLLSSLPLLSFLAIRISSSCPFTCVLFTDPKPFHGLVERRPPRLRDIRGSLLSIPTASLAQWLRRPPQKRKIRGSNPACDGIFPRSSHTSDFKIGTSVTSLLGSWHYRVSAGTCRPGHSIL